MENKKLTIDDLLAALAVNTDLTEEEADKLSPREIWDLIAQRASFEDMGFESESKLKDFIADNSYDSIA